MKAHEFFGALIRAIGIWQIANGLVLLPSLTNLFGQTTGLPRAVVGRAIWTVVASSGVHIVVGVLLFASANWLVRLFMSISSYKNYSYKRSRAIRAGTLFRRARSAGPSALDNASAAIDVGQRGHAGIDAHLRCSTSHDHPRPATAFVPLW